MGLFDDIGNFVGGAVSTVAKAVTAPAQVVINTAQVVVGQADPSTIYRPFQELGASVGNTVVAGVNLATAPERFLYQKAQEAAQAVGGDAGAFIFDVGTFTKRLYGELAVSNANVFANVLRQQNPLQ